MIEPGSSGAAVSVTGPVCTACPLLCDDVDPGRRQRACEFGVAAFMAADGGAVHDVPETTISHAATRCRAARRVLVTGLVGATNEALLAACDLAETLGAAVDSGGPETARTAGPTIARIGAVTADWEELRDRADLVIFWFCDPATSHPRFIERFVAPPTGTGCSRRTVSVGPAAVLEPGSLHVHCQLPGDAAVAGARLLEAAIAGIDPGPAAADNVAAVATLSSAVSAAGCVALVAGHADDRVGIEPWAVASLVRRIAHVRPAFAVPLGAGIAGHGAHAAGAAAICTWRYGAAGAIARADRGGAAFLPAEADAMRLVARGEVDCLIAVGGLPAPLDAAIGGRPDLEVIRIADPATLSAAPRRDAVREIHLPCASLFTRPSGTMLRGDGRRIVLGPETGGADSMAAVVARLHARVRDLPAPGGRP